MNEPRGPVRRLAMQPEGALGRLFGRLMERMNRGAYHAAVHHLEPGDGGRFLEIGFGTGRLVELLLAAGPDVRVAGVDPSRTMVRVASRRRGVRSAGERADLREAADTPLPFGDATFDGVAALHCFQFWPRPRETVQEIRRVLRPEGRLVLILRKHSRNPPDWLPNPLSHGSSEAAAASGLLAESGFSVRSEAPAGSSRVLVALR